MSTIFQTITSWISAAVGWFAGLPALLIHAAQTLGVGGCISVLVGIGALLLLIESFRTTGSRS